MSLHEECGIFGAVLHGETEHIAFDVYNALFALQHRGQHSAGIAVSGGAEIQYKKGDGLVQDVFSEADLNSLTGDMAIGHVRYASQLGTSGVNAQPVVVSHKSKYLALTFNGCLTNTPQLRRECEEHGAIFQTTGDAEIILNVIIRELLKSRSPEFAVLNTMHALKGAFSIVLIMDNKLVAMRDPQGFRPLCLGKTGEDLFVASESCAFDAIGAEFVRDIQPGEVLIIDREHMRSLSSEIDATQSLCVFEFIYFARPDSVIDGVSVELARQEAGRCLARRDNVEADVVIGVPDSGLSAALGYSYESGIPYGHGLIKNRYIGRTFIQATQRQRERSVELKLSGLSAVIKDKRVVLIDDSIVRGTTGRRIVNLLRLAGAKEVHMRISSPPFLYPCFFGTDIPNREVLLANQMDTEGIRKLFCLDSLMFMETEDLKAITPAIKCGTCDACFTGKYSVPLML